MLLRISCITALLAALAPAEGNELHPGSYMLLVSLVHKLPQERWQKLLGVTHRAVVTDHPRLVWDLEWCGEAAAEDVEIEVTESTRLQAIWAVEDEKARREERVAVAEEEDEIVLSAAAPVPTASGGAKAFVVLSRGGRPYYLLRLKGSRNRVGFIGALMSFSLGLTVLAYVLCCRREGAAVAQGAVEKEIEMRAE